MLKSAYRAKHAATDDEQQQQDYDVTSVTDYNSNDVIHGDLIQ